MRRLPVIRRKSFFLVIPLVLILSFVLASCSASGTGGTSGSGSGATPAPTTVKGYGAAYGCPSDAVVTTAPAAPNVTVHITQSHSTVNAHTGDVVEFDLPFGQRWTGPTSSVGGLELQTPAGYANKTTKMCVWRFVAQGTGTPLVSFYGRAICLKGQLCPQYVMSVPFEIKIQ